MFVLRMWGGLWALFVHRIPQIYLQFSPWKILTQTYRQDGDCQTVKISMTARSDSGTEIAPSGQNGVTWLGAWADHIAQQAILALLTFVRALPCLLFGPVFRG